MSEDNSMKSALGVFDSLAGAEGPPQLKFLSQPSNPPVRNPLDKFMEWSLGGGAALALVLTAVVLFAGRWSFYSANLLVIPLVVLLVRPFLGAYPLANGMRVAGVTFLGVVLSLLGVSTVQFVLGTLEVNRFDVLHWADTLQQSISHGTDPMPTVVICLLGWLGLMGSRRLASHNPWLDRPRGGYRAMVACAVVLGVLALVPLSTVMAVLPKGDQSWVERAQNSPRMEVYRRARNFQYGTWSFDSDWLAQLGLSQEWQPNENTINAATDEELLHLAAEFTTKLRENRESLTGRDVSVCRQLTEELMERKLSTREVVWFWDQMAEAASYWKLRWSLDQSHINGYHTTRLVIPALKRGELTPAEMEALRERVRARTSQTQPETVQERDLAVLSELDMVHDPSNYYGYERAVESTPLRLFGLSLDVHFDTLLARAEKQYFLNRYNVTRQQSGDFSRTVPWSGPQVPSLFSAPLTEMRLSHLSKSVVGRTELLPYDQPNQLEECLDKLLGEARGSK